MKVELDLEVTYTVGGTFELWTGNMILLALTRLKIKEMKKINLNDEVNAKILQILDEHENDIAAANKALEKLYEEQQGEGWDDEDNNEF